MKSRLLFLSIVLLGSVFQSQSHAESQLTPARKSFFHDLNSRFMEIVEEGSPYFNEPLGSYPWFAQLVQKDFFKWNPRGSIQRNSTECDPTIWQNKVLKKDISADQLTTQMETLLHRCEKQWETGHNNVLVNTLGMVSLQLHPNEYPFGRHVIFHLPNNVKLKGLLAMKTDQKKRPLIIFRTGIFSNTQEFYPERFLFLQMFEQSPFNVLVLESLSGSEFLKHNSSYAIGGFDEGLQNFLIAQELQKPDQPISKFISEVHIMGLSMGGPGAIFSALLNQLNPAPSGKPVLQSVLAFCPLLNMQETLDYHMSQGFSMDLMNYYSSRRLKVLKDRIPGIHNDTFIQQFFNWIRDHYRGPLIAENGRVPGIKLPEGMQKLIDEDSNPEKLFWQLNHFWPWYNKVQTPVVIFSTRKDPIVSWFINSGRIEDHRMEFADSNLKMFSFEQGFHCSLPVAYDWGSLATLFQTYFLKLSPNFSLEPKEFRFPLKPEIYEKFKFQKAFLALDFEVKEKSAALKTRVRFDSEENPGWLSRKLAPTMEMDLPLSEMEFPLDGVVQSKDEAYLLRRWAYENVKARIEDADLVFSWKRTP